MRAFSTLALAGLAWLALGSTSFADVRISIHDGQVSLAAKDATVRQILTEIQRELGETRVRVVATGGYAELIAAGLPEIDVVRPNLTLNYGIRYDIEFTQQFAPTYSSWLNLIECQFQALRSFALNGSDYRSHAEQDAAILAYLAWSNSNARPAKPWRIKAEVHHSAPNLAA